jgi:hypothetical protein
MRAVQWFGVLAFLLAAAWLVAPGAMDDVVTGSIAEMAALPEALSCDQPLFLEELELATGHNCS